MRCESDPGAGALFEFAFLAAPAAAPEPRPEPQKPLELGKPNILVVEDNPTNQKIMGVVLDLARITPTYAEHGEEACRRVMVDRFDIILMDLQMPVMDGLTAIRAIRAWERETGAPPTPIIAVSADAMVHQVEEALAAGADGHISKPINPSALLTTLAEMLDRRADQSPIATVGR